MAHMRAQTRRVSTERAASVAVLRVEHDQRLSSTEEDRQAPIVVGVTGMSIGNEELLLLDDASFVV